MTEVTVYFDESEREKVDWVAFVCALVLAPIAVAILGFWAFGVPVFALIFGPPTYLLFGAPAFAYAINRHKARARGLALAGFLANIASAPAVFLFGALQGDALFMVGFILGYGCLMAPLWGFAFGVLYRQLRIDEVI